MKGDGENLYQQGWNRQIENNDSNEKGLQSAAQFDERVIDHIKQIPWGHHQRIINECKTIDEAIYYVNKTIENGWSRNVLVHQLKADYMAGDVCQRSTASLQEQR